MFGRIELPFELVLVCCLCRHIRERRFVRNWYKGVDRTREIAHGRLLGRLAELPALFGAWSETLLRYQLRGQRDPSPLELGRTMSVQSRLLLTNRVTRTVHIQTQIV